MGWGDYEYKPYVSVAKRRAQAAREVARRTKKGETICPVVIEGRAITTTFWGEAWCSNLESYSDYASRLPRGRTYVRNGSVIDLKIEPGRIKAMVSGSELYQIQIDIAPLPKPHWLALKQRCAGQISSLVELLQGKLSKGVMELVTDQRQGLFPRPNEIKLRCSCPDYAGMCKHLAAVMYGVGNRLDSAPELLFRLRGLDHAELIAQAIPAAVPRARRGAPAIAANDLGAIFDIDIEVGAEPETVAPAAPHAKPTVKAAAKPTTDPKRLAPPAKPSTTAKRPAATTKPTTTAKRPAATTKPTTTAKRPAATTKPTTTAKRPAATTKPTATAKTPTAAAVPSTIAKRSTASTKSTTASKQPAPTAQPRQKIPAGKK